jgi:hypothetical protein
MGGRSVHTECGDGYDGFEIFDDAMGDGA